MKRGMGDLGTTLQVNTSDPGNLSTANLDTIPSDLFNGAAWDQTLNSLNPQVGPNAGLIIGGESTGGYSNAAGQQFDNPWLSSPTDLTSGSSMLLVAGIALVALLLLTGRR